MLLFVSEAFAQIRRKRFLFSASDVVVAVQQGGHAVASAIILLFLRRRRWNGKEKQLFCD